MLPEGICTSVTARYTTGAERTLRTIHLIRDRDLAKKERKGLTDEYIALPKGMPGKDFRSVLSDSVVLTPL